MSDNYLSDPRANTWEGWKAAFDIFAQHHKPSSKARPGSCHFNAEHDILYVSQEPAPLSAKHIDGDTVCEWPDDVRADALQLEALGFHWSSEVDCWAKFT